MVRQDRAASSQQSPGQHTQKASLALVLLSVLRTMVPPDGLTQLALTDVSGSSGSLHEHGVLTDFLQKRDERTAESTHQHQCLTGTEGQPVTSASSCLQRFLWISSSHNLQHV